MSTDKNKPELARCEELLRLRTRQLFILMTTSERISQTDNLHKQLEAIAQAIVDARLFKRALISMFGRNWRRIDMGYAGFSPKDRKALRENTPLPAEMWHEILSERFQISESYFIPHTHPLNAKIGGIPSPSKVEEFSGWHPNDFLFVPLRSHTGRIVGMISVDDPFDGKKPTSRSETLRLLELFAHRAASLIERSQLLKKLRHQEGYLKKLISSSADIIVTTDQQGKIKIFNPAAEAVFGYRQSEVRGRSVLKLYKDAKSARKIMRLLRENKGTIRNVEVDVVSKGGDVIPLSLSASILYDEKGDEIGTVGVSRDLRPIKELQQKLLDAERRATIQKTCLAMSHHIRNQLMAQVALLSHLQQDIEDKLPDSDVKKEISQGLVKALERAFQISHITNTLENPPEHLKEEKYIGRLDMLSLPTPMVEQPMELLPKKLPKLKILVADDEPIIRDGFAEFLRHFRMTVDTAADGREAIKMLRENDYDIIITDIKMPYATGFDVFKAAKEKEPNSKIILMTAFGYDPEHTIVKAAREGLEGVFFKEKPFNLTLLLKSIAKLFENE